MIRCRRAFCFLTTTPVRRTWDSKSLPAQAFSPGREDALHPKSRAVRSPSPEPENADSSGRLSTCPSLAQRTGVAPCCLPLHWASQAAVQKQHGHLTTKRKQLCSRRSKRHSGRFAALTRTLVSFPSCRCISSRLKAVSRTTMITYSIDREKTDATAEAPLNVELGKKRSLRRKLDSAIYFYYRFIARREIAWETPCCSTVCWLDSIRNQGFAAACSLTAKKPRTFRQGLLREPQTTFPPLPSQKRGISQLVIVLPQRHLASQGNEGRRNRSQ